jgi:Ca-activated chloride channel family protein
VLIYPIGFGTPEGEPVPVTDNRGEIIGYKQDQQGNVVLSKLDEDTLQSIAQIGKGRYYRASADGRELNSLLSEIDKLQKAQLQSRFDIRHTERFQIFLGLALLSLIIAELIPDRRIKRSNHSFVEKIRDKTQLNKKNTSAPSLAQN